MRSVCSADYFPHDISPHPSLKTAIQSAAAWVTGEAGSPVQGPSPHRTLGNAARMTQPPGLLQPALPHGGQSHATQKNTWFIKSTYSHP